MSEAVISAVAPLRQLTRDYLELSKSRIVMMVVITTAAGFVFAPGSANLMLMLHALVGTALVAAGTNALNQYFERNHDAQMHRTSRRPLPAGRITPRSALLFSSGVALVGTAYLGLVVNWTTAFLGAFTLTSYIFVYTPLKRISTACTLVGAIPGAVPPLMGWAAATGELTLGGWILFGILFFWQLPHFMAISWIYREDYARGGFVMLSVQDAEGGEVARQAIYYSLALLAVSVMPTFFGLAGYVYLAGAVISGVVMLGYSIRLYFERNVRNARALFMVSNLYLVTVMALLVAGAR